MKPPISRSSRSSYCTQVFLIAVAPSGLGDGDGHNHGLAPVANSTVTPAGQGKGRAIHAILSPDKGPAMDNQSFSTLLHIVSNLYSLYDYENFYPYATREIQILPVDASFELPRTGLCAVSHGCKPVVPFERMIEAPQG